MRRLVWLLWIVGSILVSARAARADGSARDVLDGRTARAKSPPDLVEARIAFERASRSSDADAAAAGFYWLGEMDDDALDFAGAVAHYGASVTRLSSSRYASRAARRKDQLESHAEGAFAPLVRLERLRRDPVLSSDPSAIDALVQEADGFPPGRVRVEARLLAAEAYRGRLHRPGADLPLLWEIVRDARADLLSQREAAAEIVDSEIDLHDLDAASLSVRALGGTLDSRAAARVARLTRRRAAHVAAVVAIGAFLGLLAFGLARRRTRGALVATRRIFALAAAFSLFSAGGGGLLAASYEIGSAWPFLMLGPTTLVIILLSRLWGTVGATSFAARATRGALSASSLFAATFLLLERLTPDVLEGFGL